jgi:hypothetical protein
MKLLTLTLIILANLSAFSFAPTVHQFDEMETPANGNQLLAATIAASIGASLSVMSSSVTPARFFIYTGVMGMAGYGAYGALMDPPKGDVDGDIQPLPVE